ncbi:hypothetical protein [Actinomadura roseirufa]|uniref:hypothetical protein n=1 Tax=Actinomadura roseirufa TaxID=2094049 RepID=UPI0010417376|nr:hypothetical protein [Actinomadura roseirufa]
MIAVARSLRVREGDTLVSLFEAAGVVEMHEFVRIILVEVFLFVWPMLFIVRAAVRGFREGFIASAPLKFFGAILVGVLIAVATRDSSGEGTACGRYVRAELEFFDLFAFGFVVILLPLRYLRATERMAVLLERETWGRPARMADGIVGAVVAVFTAPLLVGLILTALQVPPSPLANALVRIFRMVLDGPLIILSRGFGAGSIALEDGLDRLAAAVTGEKGLAFPVCPGDSYDGAYAPLALLALALVPVMVALSFEPLLYGAELLRLISGRPLPSLNSLCPVCCGYGVEGRRNILLLGVLCSECGGSGMYPAPLFWYSFGGFVVKVLVAGACTFFLWLGLDLMLYGIQAALGN